MTEVRTAPTALHSSAPTRGHGLPFEVLLQRLLGVAAFLCIPTAVGLAFADSALHHSVQDLAGYSPARLAHGAVWTLPASAFLVPRLAMVGTTTLFVLGVFLPLSLVAGTWRAAQVFLAGHCVSTLIVATVIVAGAAMGWSAATAAYAQADVGASAGLAACAGALVYLVGRWSRAVGIALFLALVWLFVSGAFYRQKGDFEIAEAEHLLALATGVLAARILLPARR
jgi:hypothetical protein